MGSSEGTSISTSELPAKRRRAILVSKWRALPALYWSILVGVLTAFSAVQATALKDWSSTASTLLLGLLLALALLAAIIIAWRQKTPTEKLAMARTYFSEARRRFGEKDYDGAETAAVRSADNDPDESSTWNLLGRIRIRRGDSSGAVEAFARALDVNVQPDWRTIYLHNRAVAYVLARDFGRARNDLDTCVRASPHSWTKRRWRALVNLYMEDVVAALRDARTSVEEARRVSNTAVLAIVELAAGNDAEAEEVAVEARALETEKAEDYYYLGALEARLGRIDEAERLLRISQQLDDKMKPRAQSDPLWEAWRDNPQFRGLLGGAVPPNETE